MPKKREPVSGLRVNGKPVHAESGVRAVCRALQYVATRGEGAGVEPAPRQLLEAIGAGRAGAFAIIDDSAVEPETVARLRQLAEQVGADDDSDIASILAGVASALEMARELRKQAAE